MSEFPAASVEVLSQDAHARVSRWTFVTGQATGMHIHEYDYTAIPISGGDFIAHLADGSSVAVTQIAGEPYSRQAGVHHNVQFVGEGTAQFIEVEYLGVSVAVLPAY